MKKQITVFVAGLLCTFSSVSLAQDDIEPVKPRTKLFEHQVGVQMNELVRQVFNFNGTGSSLNNPYLLMYSLNLAKSGWGVRLGLGPEFNTFKDDDGITIRENNVNKINARLGLEKSFRLSDRWTAGAGLDGVYSSDISYSKTSVRSFDSTRTDLASQTTTQGGGAMGWLRYRISSHVLIGSEASFYYRTGKYKQKIEITRRVSNGIGTPKFETSTTELDNKLKEGVFNLPMVFYLIVRF
ncbi:MAG: hypothetical protein KDC07_04585 [Chitinophagaceae bacterium]|nr:hypothetical protein [Chitinophagaceae bacterium]MCB9046684.1 hypothetical protein [Chitinophagales bacterium]